MFGIGFWELALIVLFILLVMGPDKIGPIARALGRAMREMRRGVDEFKDTFQIEEQVRDIEALRSEIVDGVRDGVVDAARRQVIDDEQKQVLDDLKEEIEDVEVEIVRPSDSGDGDDG
ncbi:MAG: twin-arginine translocase TatA/TatE family subunit [Deltaproteobacteria bacterium]|nr:twin-arginine translocase TatA/TatE family subunit [Deltaproteobacteria bacterium]